MDHQHGKKLLDEMAAEAVRLMKVESEELALKRMELTVSIAIEFGALEELIALKSAGYPWHPAIKDRVEKLQKQFAENTVRALTLNPDKEKIS